MTTKFEAADIELNQSIAAMSALQAGLTDLRAYLTSSKFEVDSTVQVRDILARLATAESAATDAYFAAGEPAEDLPIAA